MARPKTLTADQAAHLAGLAALNARYRRAASVVEDLQRKRVACYIEARRAGLTWRAIGDASDITPEAVVQAISRYTVAAAVNGGE